MSLVQDLRPPNICPKEGTQRKWDLEGSISRHKRFTQASHAAGRSNKLVSCARRACAEGWKEPILVSIDFEDLCWFLTGKYASGSQYYYKPITEVGWTWLDTRTMVASSVAGEKPYPPPGDRGFNLRAKMKAQHFIINEFRGHFGALYLEQPNTSIRTILVSTLERQLHHLLKSRERTAYEKANKIDRNVVFLTWDSTLEEDTLARLGLDWFSRPNIQLLDLQMHHALPRKLGCSHDLVHNAANDTVFQMQILLALEYMDEGLKEKIRLEQSLVQGEDCLDCLPYPWSGRTFDQENNPGFWANADDKAPVLKRIEDYYYVPRSGFELNYNDVAQAPSLPKEKRKKR
ncbi:hypothetical protein FPCIR_5333 [Fusarium pseudocircinatum]|uniref:Gfd2/YDR514C-like C-terminal domain-containing protein n=1 Tax=Fusarium pseudocircinatum TaxID=56676 RepID=A0A8H5UP32_9HYPO|nr:hypothetical protein FPCIR_5333 [Fusarium pseudocircinatum]